MDREAARQLVKAQVPVTRFLTKSKGADMYNCPGCGSGTHAKGTGAAKVYDDNTVFCHECNNTWNNGRPADPIDLYMLENDVRYNDALAALAADLGQSIDTRKPEAGSETKQQPAKENTEPTAEDIAAYCWRCYERLYDEVAKSYLIGRGISVETAEAYYIGYDPQADPANAPAGIGKVKHPEPRIIIPVTTAHYIGRAIRSDIKPQYAKMNNRGGKPGVFNMAALYAQGAQEVFVTEGVFDALSILEAGAPAVALNSVANAEVLIKQLERERTEATLILCLDNDSPGKKAAETIRQGLQRLSIGYITADICGEYKDPNEHLQKDRKGFIEAIQKAQRENAPKPDNTAFYIDKFMEDEIEAFRSDTSTGFENLDKKAGGLYSGLYVLAAISSLGKTTFAQQMGDQIAASGHDVLYFSLEQSRLEMVTKSLARITAQQDPNTAVTSLSIRKGYKPQQVKDAAAEYRRTIEDRMSIIEGNFTCSISFIGDYVRRYIDRNKVKPVVIVDYLQILQPEEKNGRTPTTKETVDSTVTALKRLSRDLGLTIIAICSVNRANYLTPIDFESLKESGNIEYTADVIWGLQLGCLSDGQFDGDRDKNITKKREAVKEAKKETPRSVDLVCLKNRYGVASYTCRFDYYPANDLFIPILDFGEDD